MSESPGTKHHRKRTVNQPTIVSFRKRGERFTIIRKSISENKSLSWEARGMLLYLLGKPRDWKVRVADLINNGTAKERQVRAILNELRTAGFAFVMRENKGGKIVGWTWFISDEPVFLSGSPDCFFAHVQNGHSTEEGCLPKPKRKVAKKHGLSPLERDPELHAFAIKGTEPVEPNEILPPIEHNRFGPKLPPPSEFEEIDF